MRHFIFQTCLVIEEPNLVRVRAPASEDHTMTLRRGADEVTEKFGPDASVLVTVHSPEGKPGFFPFDVTDDKTYDPYIEFFFVGGCVMEQLHQDDGSISLLVASEGEINIIDPTDAMPFSLGQLIESDVSETGGETDPDPGPHSPEYRRAPKS